MPLLNRTTHFDAPNHPQLHFFLSPVLYCALPYVRYSFWSDKRLLSRLVNFL